MGQIFTNQEREIFENLKIRNTNYKNPQRYYEDPHPKNKKDEPEDTMTLNIILCI